MLEITKGNNVVSSLASDMRLSVDDRMIALRNIVLLNDAAEMQAQVDRVRVQAQNYADEESKLLEDIQRQSALALPLIDKVQALGLDNNNAEATKLLIGELRAVQQKWQTGRVALIASEKGRTRKRPPPT